MRHRNITPVIFAAVSTLALVPAVRALTGYNIYPVPAGNGGYAELGNGISTNGTYAAGMYAGSGGAGNGVLYNFSTGTSTFETQTGVIEPGTRGVVETTGVPIAVTNGGIMFGSSGAGSTVETGAPTVWNNGAAANLPTPIGASGGQVYGANNLNQAVGSVKLSSAGQDIAAVYFYNATTPSSSYGAVLSGAQTTNGGTLQDAFAINDNEVIVGTANDPNNAAVTVPFIYTLGNSSASIIPNSSLAYNAAIPFAISNSGLVTGSEVVNSGGGNPFIYNMSSGVTTSLPVPAFTGGGSGRGINDSGEVVGTASGVYAVPFLYNGIHSYDLQTLLANNQSGAWQLDDNTSSGAFGIADDGDIVGRANYNGALTAFIMVPSGTTVLGPDYKTWNNAGGNGDGVTWDTNQQNFNDGTNLTKFSNVYHDYVSFTDANNGNYNVSIPATVMPGTTTFANSAGNYVVNGPGGIGGTSNLTKSGTGTLTLNNVNTYTGSTSVYGGTVILAAVGALPSTTYLSIYGTLNNSGTVVVPSYGAAYAITLNSIDTENNGTLDSEEQCNNPAA